VRVAIVIALLLGLASSARAQEARMQLESEEAYEGMPFGVVVVAEGFELEPAPAQPTLSIPGAIVTPMGVDPQVQRISINGRRSETVTWLFRWRVEAPKAGAYQVGAVTVVQGAKKATAPGGAVQVTAIETTDDMKIEVKLPDRPIWLGEAAPVEIHWLLRKDVHDQRLAVPLLAMPGELSVTVPVPADARQVLAFPAGATDLELPYTRDQVVVDGKKFTRFVFTVQVTPLRAGAIAIPAAQVVASLETGQGRDRYGFPTARTQLFRATDAARTLEVKPLPQTGRPASFAGAVGSSFSIATRTSRSVVQLGEPVDLEITVKGDTRLDGLALGPLAGAGRLPADRFAMADTPPPGELSADGKTKTFRVAVQVTDPATNEIPPIELAWFDPALGEYRTTKSEPIALSVKGGTVVGAGDVIATRPAGSQPSAAAPDDVSLVGADLALSAPGAASERPLSGPILWALIGVLYLVPLGLLGARVWRLRTASAREEQGEVAAARKKVDDELARARTAPAREVAAPLAAALRQLARVQGRAADDPVLARIETEGFAPDAADQPLSERLRADAAAMVKRILAAVVVMLSFTLSEARAEREPSRRADSIADGRAAYEEAWAATDPTVRQAAFARAADAFERAAAERPDAVELLADWGNAALGAADFGTATLAYRRALRIDGDHPRAKKNLGWLRDRLPETLRPPGGGATSALFFFHGTWTRSTRLVVGAAAFAIGALLLVPWRRRPGASRISFAAAAAIVWIVMTGSALLDRGAAADAVVVESQPLRSADAATAPVASANPLPPGVEVTLLEQRPGWSRVRTPGGATGWLPASAVIPIEP
jgi:hypothetical protein